MLSAATLVGGRYRIDGLLASSGMADVYAATDERLDRPVALKLLRAAGPTDQERFRREMSVLAQFEHPNLVRLYDAGEHDGVPYLILELVDGETLADHIARRHGPSARPGGDQSEPDADQLLADLGAALAYVHANGVVHRDVKPSNVLLDPDGRARLTDFGIAHVTDATPMTGTAMTVGTAAYMAPEQIAGGVVGPSADVYALGLVVLEFLTGRREFAGPATEAAVARLTRDPHVPDDLDPSLRALLSRMTAREPAQRPSAAELATPRRTDAAAATVAAMPTAPRDESDAARTATLPVPIRVPADAHETEASSNEPESASRRPRRPRDLGRVLAIGAATVAALALLVGILTAITNDDNSFVPRTGDAPAATEVKPVATTTPTTTTTAPPVVTQAPVVVIAPDCGALQAQRRALDDAKKSKGPGPGAPVDKRALDDQKKALDDQLKACR